ncbi:helix-turn-helix domain-containing protein [Streptomyces sp. WM6368]|uniref:helix-turn-helix domain-containing protein n=1 Tax=Streptomyces sp. WM6368 TaxID=1415554 RepID=UPI001F3BB41D|nr:transposase family protein [Streptomyces sp. WM6368]
MLIEELAPRWEARCEFGRHGRREAARMRPAGAGPKYELVFVDRLPATLVHLRTGLTHQALGVIYEVGSSTIGRAIGEIRPLLASRGFAVPGRPGVRLRTLEDVFAYAAAEDITLKIDGMETQVRRPRRIGPADGRSSPASAGPCGCSPARARSPHWWCPSCSAPARRRTTCSRPVRTAGSPSSSKHSARTTHGSWRPSRSSRPEPLQARQ